MSDQLDLVEHLERLAAERPDRRLFTELADGRDETGTLTPAELLGRARVIADRLVEQGVGSGEVAILIATSPLEFLVGFMGCLYVGVVPAPLSFPRRPDHVESRLDPVSRDAQAVAVVASDAVDAAERAVLDRMVSDRTLVLTATTPGEVAAAADLERRSAGDLAYLQYTSGSTSQPKGVVVKHHEIVEHIRAWQRLLDFDQDSVWVGWVPLTHDLGLASISLAAIVTGHHCVLMPPGAFVKRPIRWLQAMDRYRGTHTASPNFGYDLAVDRSTPEERAALDLSCVRVFANCAEPVREGTRQRFFEAFGPRGVALETWAPSWGLAEIGACVTGSGPDAAPLTSWFDGAALEQGRVIPLTPGDPGARPLCGNGPIDVEHEIRVVDPETGRDSEPGVVGELWLRGPAVCTGYWQRPEETAAVFEARVEPAGDGPYLRSGDFGFVHDGEVFVCGRMKHLIIIRGRNIYPQDVELAVERSHAAVRPGCSIAFAHDTPVGEELIVLAEVAGTPDEEEVVLAVKNAVLREFEIRPADVMLLPPRGVPKTSSGKLARNAARDLWLRGGPDPDQNDVGLSGR